MQAGRFGELGRLGVRDGRLGHTEVSNAMKPTLFSSGGSARGLLVGAMVALAGLSASAVAQDAASRGQPDVVRIRRGGSSTEGGSSTVGVTRGAAPEASQSPPALASAPAPIPASDGASDGEVTVPDLDPTGAGLPDAQPGEGPGVAQPSQTIILEDIGVRGEREGRTVKFIGAEVVFADCAVEVLGGTPLGYTGVMGRVNPNPGSAPAIRFTLESGGTITLTIQPLPGNRGTPLRPVRTVTMQVP